MKIVLFIDSLCAGGAQRQLVGLAKLLKQSGHQVQVITYYDIPFYLEFLQKCGVPYKNVAKAQCKYSRIYHIYREIKFCNPDWIIAYLDTPSMIACMCKLIKIGAKLLVSERNTTQVLTLKTRLKFLLYKVADVVVANSCSQEKFVLKHFPFLQSKMCVITNFVDTDYFSPIEFSRKDTDICRIICVGRIARQKNVLRFIKAIHVLVGKEDKFHVVWYGRGDKEYKVDCERLIEEYGLSKYFEFREPIRNIRDKYREADMCCLPSIYEGFPNVICEAMSCGLPILCGNVCDNPFMVKHNVNGLLFDPLNEYDMAEKLRSFIALPFETKKAMSLKNREDALDKFSEKRFVRQYLSLLNS